MERKATSNWFEKFTESLLWAIVAAFGTYFSMYLFRKPFTAAKFEDLSFWGIGFKSILVISQVLGYTISKFIGIRLVSEAPPQKRIYLIIGLVLFSECALLGFGSTPAPWNLVFLFLNGIPLGVVFGLVLSFLEGRKQTELLTAGLCVSFIVADGFAKSVGKSLIDSGTSEFWMPAIAGARFIPFLLFFCWMLSKVPPPTDEDKKMRSERTQMNKSQRKDLYKKYSVGLFPILFIYGLVGVVRGVKGDFAPEIWASLNTKVDAAAFSSTELYSGLGVLISFGLVSLVKDNRRGFLTGIGLSIVGCLILAASLFLIQGKIISPYAFMVLSGFGMYLPYIAVHTTLFERLMAMTQERGTIGYLMYLADAGSYAAYVLVLLARNVLSTSSISVLPMFVGLCWALVVTGIIAFLYSAQKLASGKVSV
ncbi:MAG: DUF5690 family protein [Fimbriimonas sp.]|jgi:hypothetical protein